MISGPPPRGSIPRRWRRRRPGGTDRQLGNGPGWNGGIERRRRQAPPAENPARQDKQLEIEQSDLRIDAIAEDDGVMILAEIPVSDSDGVRASRRGAR